MKQLLKLKSRPKKVKPVAIHNYRAAYLDKRSKTYHKIVMTAFAGLFGMAGIAYVFGASASTTDSETSTTTATLWLLIAVGVTAVIVGIVIVLLSRKK